MHLRQCFVVVFQRCVKRSARTEGVALGLTGVHVCMGSQVHSVKEVKKYLNSALFPSDLVYYTLLYMLAITDCATQMHLYFFPPEYPLIHHAYFNSELLFVSILSVKMLIPFLLVIR